MHLPGGRNFFSFNYIQSHHIHPIMIRIESSIIYLCAVAASLTTCRCQWGSFFLCAQRDAMHKTGNFWCRPVLWERELCWQSTKCRIVCDRMMDAFGRHQPRGRSTRVPPMVRDNWLQAASHQPLTKRINHRQRRRYQEELIISSELISPGAVCFATPSERWQRATRLNGITLSRFDVFFCLCCGVCLAVSFPDGIITDRRQARTSLDYNDVIRTRRPCGTAGMTCRERRCPSGYVMH